jgi:transcriptional regulator of acetoin/glycerol metabolism
MKEDMTLRTTTQMENQVPPDRSTGPSPEAMALMKDSGSYFPWHNKKGVVTALVFSLGNLDGCIELISEGRPAPVMQIMEELERDIISQAMTTAHANIRGAAVLLGIKYSTLYAKIKKHRLRFTKAVCFCQDSPITNFEWPSR